MADKVLFSCAGVQYRKQAGQLHVTPAKVIFFTENKQLAISKDIITGCMGSRSAASKAQIVTAAKAYVFVFNETKFRDAFVTAVTSKEKPTNEKKQSSPAPAVKLPEQPKEITIPKSGSTEAQIRAMLLAKDVNLRKAYQEVVEESQLISSAEFWRTREHLLELERHSTQSQQVGLSSAMLGSVQPASDGTSTGTIAYTLSSSAIAEILAKHGAVRRAYEDNVPDKLSEQDFWTKYFQSQYFRRARDHFVGAESEESVLNPIHDIFSRYEDQADMQQSLREKGLKPSVHLDRVVNLTLNESDEEGGSDNLNIIISSRERDRLHLIKEFNKHSKIVLGHAGENPQQLPSLSEQRAEVEVHELEITTGRREVKTVHLDESQLAKAKDFLETQLNGVFQYEREKVMVFPEIITQLSHQCRTTDRKAYSQNGFVIFSADQPDERISDKILSAVRSRSVKATELLRHFWSCFPATPESVIRMERYIQALAALDQDIKKLRNRLHAAKYSVFVPMFDATMKAIQEASERAESVKTKGADTIDAINANKRIRSG